MEFKSSIKENISSNKSFGKSFTLLLIIVFIFFAYNRNVNISIILMLMIVFSLIASLKFPFIFKYINIFFSKVAKLLSKIINPIILLTIYILVIIPSKIFMIRKSKKKKY